MTFPVWIGFGAWRVHPHVAFELLAFAVATLAELTNLEYLVGGGRRSSVA